jgi:predicted metal-binding membrane protein
MMQPSPLLRRERYFILALLLVLAAAGWAIVAWQAGDDDTMSMSSNMGMDMSAGADLTMGMGAALFIGVWVAMMVAMMFPAAAPMVVMFNTIARGKRERGQTFVPTWVFVCAYLLVWTAFGVLAYLLAIAAEDAADGWTWLMDNGARIGGGIVVLAGLYQLSPLKHACLSKCRTPMQFVMTSWRDGYDGALRMGITHGAWCLGCCWLLFAMLFPLGVMNIAAMVLVTALIFAEKALPWGTRIGQAAGIALVAWGALVLVWPEALLSTL